jgi:hypothetical protein
VEVGRSGGLGLQVLSVVGMATWGGQVRRLRGLEVTWGERWRGPLPARHACRDEIDDLTRVGSATKRLRRQKETCAHHARTLRPHHLHHLRTLPIHPRRPPVALGDTW